MDENMSGIMTRSQIRRSYSEGAQKKKSTPESLKKIQTRSSVINSINKPLLKKSPIVKDKSAPSKLSRRLADVDLSPNDDFVEEDVKKKLDRSKEKQSHNVVNDEKKEMISKPKEKTMPTRRSRRLSGVEHGTEKDKKIQEEGSLTKSSKLNSGKKGKMSAAIDDIEELDHSSEEQSHIDNELKRNAIPIRHSRKLLGVCCGTEFDRLPEEDTETKSSKLNIVKKGNISDSTPLRRSRRLSGVDHAIENYMIPEEGTKTKSSKLNSVKKGKAAAVMSDIEEFDLSEDDQPHTDKESTKVLKEKKSVTRSRKQVTENDKTQEEIIDTVSSKLSPGNKRKIAEVQDNDFDLSKEEQSHVECNDHSTPSEVRESSKGLSSPKTKKKEKLDKSEKEIASPGNKSRYNVPHEDSDNDGKDKSKKVDSPRMVGLPPKKKYTSFQHHSNSLSEFENRSENSVKDKVSPQRKSAINSSEDDSHSKKKEILKFSKKKCSFPENKLALSPSNNSISESENSSKRAPKKKISLEDSDSDNKNEEEGSVLLEKKFITSLSSEEMSSESESNHEKVRPTLKKFSPHKKCKPLNEHDQNKSLKKRRSLGEKKCLTKDSVIESENSDGENVKFPKMKNIVVLSDEEVEEIFIPAKSTISPSKSIIKSKKGVASDSVMESVQIMPEVKQVSCFSDRIFSSPKKGNLVAEKLGSADEKFTKGVTKHHFQEKVTPNKRLNNIIEKEIISSSETLQLPSSCKPLSISPAFRSRARENIKSESSDSDSDAESRKAIMESAQKRIIQNLSTSESESKKFVRPLKKFVEEPSDSDSAPEQMSFSTGHQLEKDLLKNAVECINREKQRKKERRKQRLEKYKQQKEEKLIRLKEKRASQEDASCSSSEESGYEEDDSGTVSKSNKIRHVRQEKENLDDLPKTKVKKFHYSDDSDEIKEKKERKEKKRKHEQNEVQSVGNLRRLPTDVLENLPEEIPLKLPKFDAEEMSKEKRKSKKSENVKEKRQDFRHRTDVDYIPLSSHSSTEFGVMPLDTLARAPKSMAERAVEFRQKMLYGSHIKRGPANAPAIYQQKLKAAGRDRFVR